MKSASRSDEAAEVEEWLLAGDVHQDIMHLDTRRLIPSSIGDDTKGGERRASRHGSATLDELGDINF